MSEALVVKGDGWTLIVPASDLLWTAVRSSGPGGQNVNKVASKIELRFDLPGSRALAPDAKRRLRALARRRLDARGWLIVTSQRTRDRVRNLEDARAKLGALLLAAVPAPEPRKPTRPTRAAKRRRVAEKRRHGERKRARRGEE